MRSFLIAGLALAASTPAMALDVDPAACPAERAIYKMETGPDEEGDFSAALIPARHFVSVASDLYFRLTTPARDYWFGFSVSNGYGGITLLPVSDPYDASAEESGPRDLLEGSYDPEEGADGEMLANLGFFAMDKDLVVLTNPPVKGETAPPYLMAPELGVALWYDFQYLTENPGEDTSDSMPRGVFKKVGCLAAAPAEAFP